MRVFNSKKGSSSIEAAFVIPLVFLIICGLISIALKYYDRVYEESKTKTKEQYEELELRGIWLMQ